MSSQQHNLQSALVKHQSGQFQEALVEYQSFLKDNPNHPDALYLIGTLFFQLGQLQNSKDYLLQATKVSPNNAHAHNTLANVLQDQGFYKEAESHYQTALTINPDDAYAHNNLGTLYKLQSQFDEALVCFNTALTLNETYPEAFNNKGNVLVELRRFDEALKFYDKAIAINPSYAEAYNNKGIALQKMGLFDEGLTAHQKALEINPQFGFAFYLANLSLPILYNKEEEISFHRKRFTQGLDIITKNSSFNTSADLDLALGGLSSVTNFYLQYQGQNDLELQSKYGDFVAKIMSLKFPQFSKPLQMPVLKKDQKIRLGFVSSFMRTHTVGKFLWGWVKDLNPASFETYGYHIGQETDDLTSSFENKFDHYHHIPENAGLAAQQIRKDDLHFLIFTDIGMMATATQLVALRLAPIQAKGWGHPVTTGLPNMDYYLSSDLMESSDAKFHYREELIRLPNLALNISKPVWENKNRSRSFYKIPENKIVYLTPQSLFKYLPQDDDIYPAIAKQVPQALFVFLSHPSESVTKQLHDRLAKKFEQTGLNPEDHLIFQPRMKFNDLMGLYLISDVYLDSLNWSGGNTTIEAISQGLPIVTLPGEFMRGRHAMAMLKMIGVEEGICHSKENYIQLAIKLGQNLESRKALKQRIVDNKHKLYDDLSVVKQLENFTFDEDVGPGLPLWLPNGASMIEQLESLAKHVENKAGYQRVRTPHLCKENMYLTSGHLPYYEESMFPVMELEGVKYYLKPMNCPHHHKIFGAKQRSYRDLPVRFAEYGTCYRYEKSGELFGLMRVRSMQMNDAHIYCTLEQFQDEFLAVCRMYLDYFKLFGVKKYQMRFSKHSAEGLGKKYVNNPELWKQTEDLVRKALEDGGIPYVEVENEAAFYGPKIDVQIWSAIGREFTLATNQVDFAVPERFGLVYKNSQNQDETPLCIHRAPLSTHERLIGFLIEHYAGSFPFWLAPVQLKLLTISEDQHEFAKGFLDRLKAKEFRVEGDLRHEKLGLKIREAQMSKVPYMLVVGKKEAAENKVSVRHRDKGDLGSFDLEGLLVLLGEEQSIKDL